MKPRGNCTLPLWILFGVTDEQKEKKNKDSCAQKSHSMKITVCKERDI